MVLGVVLALAALALVPSSAQATTWRVDPQAAGSMAFGPDGALYVADSVDAYIYRIDSSGHGTVFAGTGPPSPGGYPAVIKDHGWTESPSYTGDGGPAVQAQLSFPVGLTFDAAGNLYFADHGNDVIRRIDTHGIITTVAGVGPADTFTKGQWVPGVQSKAGDGGPAVDAVLESPWGVTFDASGNLYIADRDHDAIRRVDTHGIITTVAGTGQRGYSGDGGPATSAKLNTPLYVVFDHAGNMYIADENNQRIRRVDPHGTVSTVAGSGTFGCSGDGASATLAAVTDLNGLSFGPDGSLYFGDSECYAVRRLDTTGTIHAAVGSGVAGCTSTPSTATTAQLSGPDSPTFDSRGNLYLLDQPCGVILRVDTTGHTTAFAAWPPL